MYKLLPPPDEESATFGGGGGGGLGGMKRSPAFDADVSELPSKTDEQIRCLVARTAACCVVNDDHMFPDSVTPCKVDGRLSVDYDVPYIDDDFFIFDEWYITDDKRWSCLRRAELPRLAECEDSRVTESAVTSVNATPQHKQATSGSRAFGRSVRLFQLCCGRRRRS
ncbi:hypothetical protein BOX15_Mlig022812g2 [Macrostomum lignano]|uniref:Uncharacterized protein n=1 Tax=Macrostomum lignano TaxID=282301 RepID=A0A267GW95_9PLAT|nr:hypothetical protein BOX15_Mlig022812g2 [Macrostomum lignano]